MRHKCKVTAALAIRTRTLRSSRTAGAMRTTFCVRWSEWELVGFYWKKLSNCSFRLLGFIPLPKWRNMLQCQLCGYLQLYANLFRNKLRNLCVISTLFSVTYVARSPCLQVWSNSKNVHSRMSLMWPIWRPGRPSCLNIAEYKSIIMFSVRLECIISPKYGHWSPKTRLYTPTRPNFAAGQICRLLST
jgi:hypothetical protein